MGYVGAMDWFETQGTLIFDPPRIGLKHASKWWCVINLDEEISEYYRWFLDKHWWEGDVSTMKREYHRPPWKTHLSVIRGERPNKNLNNWKTGDRTKVRIKYSNEIRQTGRNNSFGDFGKFWFLDAEWSEYLDFREYYGLPISNRGKRYQPHITIARTYTDA